MSVPTGQRGQVKLACQGMQGAAGIAFGESASTVCSHAAKQPSCEKRTSGVRWSQPNAEAVDRTLSALDPCRASAYSVSLGVGIFEKSRCTTGVAVRTLTRSSPVGCRRDGFNRFRAAVTSIRSPAAFPRVRHIIRVLGVRFFDRLALTIAEVCIAFVAAGGDAPAGLCIASGCGAVGFH
jgi:hypothetical protein